MEQSSIALDSTESGTSLDEQRLLVVPAEALSDLYKTALLHWHPVVTQAVAHTIETEGRHVAQLQAEASSELVKVVGYSLIRNGSKALCIRRAGKSDRDVLNKRYTLLYGGHVEEQDGVSVEGIADCVERELNEELGIELAKRPDLIGVVTDPTTHVGRLHLGVVFDSVYDEESVQLHAGLDTNEFAEDQRIVSHRMRTLGEIDALRDQLDPWSALALESIAVRYRLVAP